jgi:hypothetical protein
MTRRRRFRLPLVTGLVAGALVASATAPVATARMAGKTAPKGVIVFNGEGNNLNAYAAEPPFTKQTVIRNHDDDPQRGLDINAQICFFPDGSSRFIAGEDTGQPNPPPGWGIFKLNGTKIGKLSAKQVGKLTPTYQPTSDNPENFGCGFLADGRVVTTDIGDQQAGSGNGQLTVWFPPFNSRNVRYCKIDVGIATAGTILVDKQDRVYVPSARPGQSESGVYRYSGPFPTSDDAKGGCDTKDSTGAPMTTTVKKELFIRLGDGLVSPISMVRGPSNVFYVSSVISGVINQYGASGEYVRSVLQPPANESLGERTYSTGTPLGLGVGPDGTLYYADIGITITGEGIGPGPEGTVRRIRFVNGEPQPPETMGGGLQYPDGIGVYVPKKK